MKFFADISYTSLQMAQQNISAHVDESDDERNAVNVEHKEDEEEEDDPEFSTYFTDQKVDIPTDDKVLIINRRCAIKYHP